MMKRPRIQLSFAFVVFLVLWPRPARCFWRLPFVLSPETVITTTRQSTKQQQRQRGKRSKPASHRDWYNSRESSSSSSSSWVLPRPWARVLYGVTALNPLLAVLHNDYGRMLRPFRRRVNITVRPHHVIWRLRPRVTFAVGAVLRALQCTTAVRYVFDPAVGLGLGLDLLCLFVPTWWPATIVLGWSVSQPVWHALGATPPSGLPVPIAISMISSHYNRAQQQQQQQQQQQRDRRDE